MALSEQSTSTQVPIIKKAAIPLSSAPSSYIKKSKKKGNLPMLITVLVLLLGGFGAYMGYRYYPELTQGFDIHEQDKKVQIKDVDWEKSVFQHPVFQALKEQRAVSFEPGAGDGNPNPFAKKLKK